MAAHPKNKVTRVEQGKRRAGNTPKFKIDANTHRIAQHKTGLFTRFLSIFGDQKVAKTTKAEKKVETKETAVPEIAKTGIAPAAAAANAAPKMQPALKKTTRTQHKGG